MVQLSPMCFFEGKIFLVCFLGGPYFSGIKSPLLLRSLFYFFSSSFSLVPLLESFDTLDQLSPKIFLRVKFF